MDNEIIQAFTRAGALDLAPVDATGYARPKRNHDPRVDIKGTVDFPLTERIACDMAVHGEEFTRGYYLSRGVPSRELDILVAGARKVAS